MTDRWKDGRTDGRKDGRTEGRTSAHIPISPYHFVAGDNKCRLILFSRVDSDRSRGHSLRVKKRRVKMVARQGLLLKE